MVTDANGMLRTLLQRAGLSTEQLARRLNQQAAELGLPNRIDQKTPYKWFRGAVPRAPWPMLVARYLSGQLGSEISPEDLGWTASSEGILWVPADTGLVVPWTGRGALAAIAEVMDTGAMERRDFLSLTGSALTVPALDWLIASPATDVARITGRRVQDAHVSSIEDMTAQLRRMDDRFGSGAVLSLVSAQVRYVVELLRDYSYTSSAGTRLHAAAAELLRLAGWMSCDAGRQARAQRYWLGALRAAHAAGDRAIGANVLGFMSAQAKSIGLYDDAIRLSEAARRGYPGSSPRVAAILNLRAAQAYASTGDKKACHTAIDTAYGLLRDETPAGAGWAYWLDEAVVNEQIGSCYMRLEDWGRAQGHLRTAIKLQTEPYTREGALRRARLAFTYARQGEHERACEVGGRAVDILADGVDSNRCVGEIRKVQDSLRPYRKSTVVADFNERVNTIFGTPA